jgi:hypothetical protein
MRTSVRRFLRESYLPSVPRVRRADYIAIDRHKLAYLNGIEKAELRLLRRERPSGVRARSGRAHRAVLVSDQALAALRAPHPRYREFWTTAMQKGTSTSCPCCGANSRKSGAPEGTTSLNPSWPPVRLKAS